MNHRFFDNSRGSTFYLIHLTLLNVRSDICQRFLNVSNLSLNMFKITGKDSRTMSVEVILVFLLLRSVANYQVKL